MKHLLGLILAFGLPVTISSSFADEIFHPLHGGELVKQRKTGLAYEVVRKPKEIWVIPHSENTIVPSVLTVKFKNKKGAFDQVHLKLIPSKDPGSGFTAPLPEGVLLTGGVTFDLN